MSVSKWVNGARPRTLWTALAPVAVGTAAAHAVEQARPAAAALALGVAMAFQIGVNYANDYSDGVRGTDASRVGPERLVASGQATPSAVKRAAVVAFALAVAFGVGLAAISELWWLIPVGAAAVVAAWTYTGSSRPYGYAGWGEVSVWVFFGPVAVLGTMVTQADEITWWAVVAAVGVGCWAVGLLMINNLRDLDGDAAAGKRTLAVTLGLTRAKVLFSAVLMSTVVVTVVVSFAHPWALLAGLTALPALLICLGVLVAPRGAGMGLFFKAVSGTGLAYGLLLAAGIAL